MPKVSIVVVNYNYSRYLDERIQSFLNQTYEDFELIIIDNGSTDNSVEIIDKYTKDPRISVKYFPENDLPFKRWNDAIDSTQGEYLLVAASDDSCHPSLLERLVEKLDAYPSVGIAFAQSWGVDSEGNRLYSCKGLTDYVDKERWSKDFVDSGKNEYQYLFSACTIPNPSGALLRSSTFFEAGKFDIELQYCVDMMMWAKMLTISDLAYIAEPLNYFRTPTDGISLRVTYGRTPYALEERLKVTDYLLQKVEAPDHFWQVAHPDMIKWWITMMIKMIIRKDGFKKVPFSMNVKIYRLFKKIDPNINFQLVKNFPELLKEKLNQHLFKDSSYSS
jgi:glycosyltransferase involved in cell wall biosynthesis